MSGRNRCRCSSVPRVTRPKQLSACTETPTPTLAQTAAELLEDLEVDLVGLAAAAVLLGVGQPEQAGLPEQCEHVAREGLAGLVCGGAGSSSLVARSRTSRIRSVASSVGITRLAGTGNSGDEGK